MSSSGAADEIAFRGLYTGACVAAAHRQDILGEKPLVPIDPALSCQTLRSSFARAGTVDAKILLSQVNSVLGSQVIVTAWYLLRIMETFEMLVSRIMRKPVTTITLETSVQAAAALMGKLDIGVLPVCDNGRPVGIVTDLDIVVRWASNAVADTPIAPIMTPNVLTCRLDQTIEQAAYLMSDKQIRRLVVLDASDAIAGIVTLGDIANDANEVLAGETMGEIVEVR